MLNIGSNTHVEVQSQRRFVRSFNSLSSISMSGCDATTSVMKRRGLLVLTSLNCSDSSVVIKRNECERTCLAAVWLKPHLTDKN